MAMHYNENAHRLHASTAAGELRYSIVCPKYKHGDFTVCLLKTHPTSGHLFVRHVRGTMINSWKIMFSLYTEGYIDTLMELLFRHAVEDPGPYQELLDTVRTFPSTWDSIDKLQKMCIPYSHTFTT